MGAKIGENVTVAVITALVLAVGSLLLNFATSGGIIRLLGGITADDLGRFNPLPPAAVVAVDSRMDCPKPWVEFSALAGRVIIGAGQGRDLSLRTVGDMGGSEQTLLAAANIPPHQHPIDAVLTEEAFGGRRGWTDNDGGWWPGRVWIRPSELRDNPGEPDKSLKATRMTGPQSATVEPFDRMPPYHVLRFCTRA